MSKHALMEVAQQAVIFSPANEVLILRRPEGVWQFPGGRLLEGEKWDTGLRREVEEETGITILEIGEILEVNNWVWNGTAQYGIFFKCRTHTTQVVLSHEHNSYHWLSPDEDFDQFAFWHPSLLAIAKRVLAKSR